MSLPQSGDQRKRGYMNLCKFLGHAWNPDGAEFYSVFHCERCGYEGNGDEQGVRERIAVRLYWWRYNFGLWAKSWREWWKCSDCGGRFGRHDDAFDHLPF